MDGSHSVRSVAPIQARPIRRPAKRVCVCVCARWRPISASCATPSLEPPCCFRICARPRPPGTRKLGMASVAPLLGGFGGPMECGERGGSQIKVGLWCVRRRGTHPLKFPGNSAVMPPTSTPTSNPIPQTGGRDVGTTICPYPGQA
ncbi:hypothetical protein LX32DRAFT_256562 [Colletotrichum zoysiae]|uniref:Uncharacterized protein n=1 Tax=Colletotrichum zoysiae TaxID=1216348 RepID=A0AAD9M4L2_9PEZI|nr:hypothetical protein LX32DRAFT_256562 [Colletotrichum zoysiae]